MDPYSYPDSDPYQDVQYSPLVGGEDSSRIRGAIVAFYSSIGAIVSLIIVTVLSFLLWSKIKGSVLFSHNIICILALIFAAFCAFYAASSRSSVSFGGSPSPLLSVIVFIGSLLFAGYFAIASIYLWAYRCIHAAGLFPILSDVNVWGSKFGGKTLLQVVSNQRCMFFTMCLLCIVIAICFAFAAYASYSFMQNNLQSSKIVLMVALTGIVVFGSLAMITAIRSGPFYQMIANYFPSFSNMTWLFALMFILIIGAAIMNAILNLLRWESVWFLMGCMWIVIGILLIFLLGLLFRDLRRNTCNIGNNQINCKVASDLVPAEKYQNFCPVGKYLPDGQSCRKIDMTINWETDSKPVFLNPGCCGAAASIAVWPFFTLAIFGMFTLMFIGLAAGANYGHTEYDRQFNDYFNSFNIVDTFTLVFVLLSSIGLLLFIFLAVKIPFVTRFTKNTPSGFSSNPDGTLSPLPSFTPVMDPGLNYTRTPKQKLPSKCYSLERAKIPLFQTGNCEGIQNCGMSVGLLATNAFFFTESYGAPASLGPKNFREYFFPDDLESRNDFLSMYGSAADINKSIRTLIVCQYNMIDQHSVYAHAITTDVVNLDHNSLTKGSINYSTEIPSYSGKEGSFIGYKEASTCVGNCKVSFHENVNGKINIVGRLMVKAANGTYVHYGVPESGIEIIYGEFAHGDLKRLAFGSYDDQGRFIIQAPFSSAADYVGSIQIWNEDRFYVNNLVDVLVTTPPPGRPDLFVGDIIMSTISGQGCKQADLDAMVQCLKGQKEAKYYMNLKVMNLLKGLPVLTPLQYIIKKTYSANGDIVKPLGPVLNGVIKANLPAGPYNVEVSGEGFAVRSEPVLLDQNRDGTIYLQPQTDEAFNVFMNIDNTKDPNADYDLALKMQTFDGQECIVNSFNPICPYAKKLNDVAGGFKGLEVIEVDKFVNGTYMVYVEKGPVYQNCPQTNGLIPLAPSTTPAHRMFGYFNSNPIYSVFTNYLGRSYGGTDYDPQLGVNEMNMNAAIVGGSGLTGGLGSDFTKILSTMSGSVGGFGYNDFNFIPQTWLNGFETNLPIRIGSVANVPLVFSYIKDWSTKTGNPIPSMDTLYTFFGYNNIMAHGFIQCLPMLYPDPPAIESWLKAMIDNKRVSPYAIRGFTTSAKELAMSGYQYNEPQVTKYLGQLLELELMNQNKRIGEENNLSLDTYYYDQMIHDAKTSGVNQTYFAGKEKPLTYRYGIGEEPYIVNSTTFMDKSEYLINDDEVGIESNVPTPLFPFYGANKTVPGLIDLVGVELDGQINIYEGNGTHGAAYNPLYTSSNFYDLSSAVPSQAAIGYAVSNSTTKYISWIVPTVNPDIVTYLQDQQGLLHIFYKNGTVVYTNIYNETRVKHVVKSGKTAEGITVLTFDDGSYNMVYPDGTTYMYGLSGEWRKVYIPIDAATLMSTIGQPATTITTTVLTTLTPANQTPRMEGTKVVYVDSKGEVVSSTGPGTFVSNPFSQVSSGSAGGQVVQGSEAGFSSVLTETATAQEGMVMLPGTNQQIAKKAKKRFSIKKSVDANIPSVSQSNFGAQSYNSVSGGSATQSDTLSYAQNTEVPTQILIPPAVNQIMNQSNPPSAVSQLLMENSGEQSFVSQRPIAVPDINETLQGATDSISNAYGGAVNAVSGVSKKIGTGVNSAFNTVKSFTSSLNPAGWLKSKSAKQAVLNLPGVATEAISDSVTKEVIIGSRLLQGSPDALSTSDAPISASEARAAEAGVDIAPDSTGITVDPKVSTSLEEQPTEVPVTYSTPDSPQAPPTQIIPRSNFSATDKVVVYFCFNAFGPRSIKRLTMVHSDQISIKECEDLYPITSSYWLGRIGNH